MTFDEIDSVYTELGAMRVQVQRCPELGLIYFGDLMVQVHNWRDRVGFLMVLCEQHTAGVRHRHRTAKALSKVSTSLADRVITDQVDDLFAELEDHRRLTHALEKRAGDLHVSMQDIKGMIAMIPADLRAATQEPSVIKDDSVTKVPSKSATLVQVDQFLDSPAIAR